MTANTAPSRARPLIQLMQLASLATRGPRAAPLALAGLSRLLAFDSSAYLYLGADGSPAVCSAAEAIHAVLPIYLQPEMQAAERAVSRTLPEAMRVERGALLSDELITVPREVFERSDHANIVLRAAGVEDCLSLIPRHPDGRPVGAVKLYRGPRRRRFGRDDQRRLASLERILARALDPVDARGVFDDAHALPVGEAMLVYGSADRLVWRSPGADRLLREAFGGRWHHAGQPPELVRTLLSNLRVLWRGANPPRWPTAVQDAADGRFEFEATALESSVDSGEGASASLVRVRKCVPVGAAVLRAICALDLPARQAEVAYWLAQGETEDAVAARIGVSLHTVVYHRRELYRRVDAHSRAELVSALRQRGLS